MKKLLYIILILSLGFITFILSYDYKNNQEPNTYYKVYLNNETLGVITDENKLNKFIDKQSDNIKNKYNVDKVYAPTGLQIENISSYSEVISNVDEIFNQILNKSSLTIDGYQISIKTATEPKIIYVTDEKVFRDAVTDMIQTFVGKDAYQAYIDNTQQQVTSTGRYIENVYVQDDITIKKTRISVNNHIYTDKAELAKFLLYGDTIDEHKYTVKLGDTISKVAYANEISAEEFLISNPQFNDKNNLLHEGQEVTIAVTNPQLKVVLEEHVVEDKENNYVTEEKYDPDKYVGSSEVIQKGENGIIRVTQEVQSINGTISYINPIDKKELKPAINEIVVKGDKFIANVGNLKNWAWPSLQGYTITDDFEWRINPVTGKREHHSGIDISGTGYGSPIYAANNGVIETKKYSSDYGYHILINHNNGYWTMYAHMSKYAGNFKVGDTVARGQVIGYVGSTGWSTGPHLHFEVWKDCEHCRVNPFSLYR